MAQAKVAAPAEVQIVGRGTLALTGLPFLLVSSSSEPGRAHVVCYAYEGAYVGSRIHCDCTAATYGRQCKHVRLVALWLAEQMAKAPLHETLLNRQRPFSMMR